MSNSYANRRIAKNSVLLSIRLVIVLGITLYTTRILLSILGIEDYGIFNVVCGFVSMFAFLNTSMSNGVQRFYNFELGKNKEDGANKVYNTALLIQILIAFTIIILTETFGLWYIHNKMVIPETRIIAAEWIFHFSILSFLFLVLQTPYMAAVMAHERMDFFAFVSVLDAIFKLAIVFCLPYLDGDNLIFYGVLLAAVSFIDFMAYVIYAKLQFKEIYFNYSFDSNLFKSMISFSGWNIFGTFSNIAKEQGLNLMLNLFFGPIVNAARGVANHINSGLQSFVSNLTIPVRPQVIQSYAKGEINRTMNLTYSISKLSSCFLYIVSLPIIIEIHFILKIWLGENIPEHTALFAVIVIAQSFINNLNSAVSGVVHASGKMRLYQLSGCLINLSALPLAYCALQLGTTPEAALLVNFLVAIFGQYVALKVLKTIVDFSLLEYSRKVINPFLLLMMLTFIFPLIPFILMDEGWVRLILVTVVSIMTGLVGIYFISLNKSEKALVRQYIGKYKQFNI